VAAGPRISKEADMAERQGVVLEAQTRKGLFWKASGERSLLDHWIPAPAGTEVVVLTKDEHDKLRAVAARATEVMNVLYDESRDDINFTALGDALVEVGLLPRDEHPWEPHPGVPGLLRCVVCGGVTPEDQRNVLTHHLPECGWRIGQEQIASRSGEHAPAGATGSADPAGAPTEAEQ
jgi:hypothetical protein